MRGQDREQPAMFGYITLEQRIPADHPRRAIRALTNRALQRIDGDMDKLYSLVSLLHREGVVEAVSYPQLKCFEAALTFARAEGSIVAPETSHAIYCVIDEALKAKEEGEEKTILFNLSGHGQFDMAALEKYFAGELSDYEYPAAKIHEPLAHLPKAL